MEVDSLQSINITCFKCQGVGHMARECPSQRGKVSKAGTSVPKHPMMGSGSVKKPVSGQVEEEE